MGGASFGWCDKGIVALGEGNGIWEERRFDGVIEGFNDYVDFQTSNIADVEKEFHCAVDDYLIFCSEVEKEPEKEYKGTFNVRIKPELH